MDYAWPEEAAAPRGRPHSQRTIITMQVLPSAGTWSAVTQLAADAPSSSTIDVETFAGRTWRLKLDRIPARPRDTSDAFGTYESRAHSHISDEINRRLRSLEEDFREDFGGSLNEASASGLMRFFKIHPWVALPNYFSADSSGMIHATWQFAGNQSASLMFIDNEKFHYAMAVENASGRVRPWGTATVQGFFISRPDFRTFFRQSFAPPL